jgi:hypothetical protein
MTSNTTQREIIDKSSIKGPHERSQELSNVGLDVSTEEGQLVQGCTSTAEGETTIESYIAAEHQPAIHIDNNSGTIIIGIITAGSKYNSNASEALLNFNINNNSGVITVGEHIQLNSGAQFSNTIEELIRKILGKTEVSPDQLEPILDGKECVGDQSNKNMKNGAGNRSEFCQSCSQHISALNYVPSNS